MALCVLQLLGRESWKVDGADLPEEFSEGGANIEKLLQLTRRNH